MTVQNAKGNDLTISVSSTETWDLCRRKWYYAYYMRLPQPEDEALLIGNNVHGLLENRLTGKGWLLPTTQHPATAVEADPRNWHRRLAEAALDSSGIDPDDHDWVVEKWLDRSKCGPLPLGGKVDLHRVHDGRLQVWDWKTTSGERWALEEDMLRRHTQPLVYAYALGTELGLQGQDFDARYIYVDKKSASAWPVDAPAIPWADAATRFDHLAEKAEEMAKLATDAPRADLVEANTSACYKYGKLCPFASFCSAAPGARVAEEFTNHSVPIIDPRNLTPMSTNRFAALTALATAAGVAAPSAAPPPAAASPAADRPSSETDPVAACAEQVKALLGVPTFSTGIPESTLLAMSKGMGANPAAVAAAAGVALVNGRFVKAVAPPPAAVEVRTVSAPEAGVSIDTLTTEQVDALPYFGMVVRFGLVVPTADAGLDVAALYAKYHPTPEVTDAAALITAIETSAAPAAPVEEVQVPPPAEPAPAPAPVEKLDTEKEVEMAAAWLTSQTWTGATVSALREAFLTLLPGRKRLGPTFVAKAVAAAGWRILEDGETVVRPAYHPPAQSAAPPPVEAPAPTPAPSPEPPAPEPPAPAAEPALPPAQFPTLAAKGMVFVNIVAEKGASPLPTFGEWVAQLEPQVIEHAKAAGMKGAEYGSWPLIEFAKGAALMGLAIHKAFAAGLAPPMMSLDTSHPLAAQALAAAHATPGFIVYRGTRG